MRRRIGQKTYDIYATDFETHNDSDLIKEYEKDPKNTKTSIWLWYLIDENSKYNDVGVYGYDLESYFNRLAELSKPNPHTHKKGYILIYDYNLSFEFSFMLYYMLNNGYKYKIKFDDADEKVFNLVTTSSMSNIWNINIKINKGKSLIVFRDLAKIMGGGTLRTLAKSYDLETQKGEIDYSINRRYKDFVPSEEEKIYCFKDVKIIMDILNHPKTQDDPIFWKVMSAASYSVQTGIKYAYPKAFKPLTTYRKRYPILDKKEADFIRAGYGGGITYCTPKYEYKIIEAGKRYNGMKCDGILHIDMHNAHPSQMYLKEFPILKGRYVEFNKKLKLSAYKGYIFKNRYSCCRCLISYTGVKLHNVIKLIGTSVAYRDEITLWDFEILTMTKCYENLEVEVLDMYVYRKGKLPFSQFFKDNYDIRKEAKKNKDYYEINHRKLLNNSFYGKLNENGHPLSYVPIISENGLSDTISINNPDATYQGKFTYLPAGTMIPAWTRDWLINTAIDYFGYKNILYFDTDSIFMLDNEETRKGLEKLPMEDDLYNWGIEEHSIKAQFACPKRYKLYADDGSTVAHVAGFNLSPDDTFDKLDIIRSERYIKRAYRIKGGTIIAPQLKRIDVDNKYMFIYEENYGK